MPIVIRLQDIDEAIGNLRYKNETTLKSRLLRAVRQYYPDDASAESLQSIDTEELVRTIWETGDDRDLLKAKRKNFSSLKSSVNADLKKLYADGKNPQGLIIGHDNIFTISDEAKDRALAGIMDVFKEKGIETRSQVSEVLSALNDILTTSISGTEAEHTREEIERLKNVLGELSGKLGVSPEDMARHLKEAGERGARIDSSGETISDLPGKGEDLAGIIHGGLSEIDQGLRGLAREIEDAAHGASKADLKDSTLPALQDIVRTLQDTQTDAQGKAQKIMTSFEQMLADAIDDSGSVLSGEQADRLKQIFRDIAQGTDGISDQTATPVRTSGDKLHAVVASFLGDGGLSAGDKIGKIMAALNEVIDETLASGGTGLSDAEITGIREMMGHITGHLGALSKGMLTDEETGDGAEALASSATAGTGAPESTPERLIPAAGSTAGSRESLLHAITDFVHALKDTGTDAPGKAQKIMAVVEQMLTDAIEDSEVGLSADQASQLKQIFHDIGKGTGFGEDAGRGGETESPAEKEREANQAAALSSLSGDKLFAEFSFILGDVGLSPGDKISRIMAAVNDMIGEILVEGGAGLSGEEIAGIKEMMGNITGNLEAFVHEALNEFDIVEEIAESTEAVIEEVAVPPDGVVLEPESGEATGAAISGEGEPLSGEGEIIEEAGGGAFDAETVEIIEVTDEEMAKAQVGSEIAAPPEGAVEKVALPTEELVEEVLLSPEAGEAADTAISGKGEPLSGKGEIIEEADGGAFDAETMEIIEATDEEIAKAQAGSEISGGIAVPSGNMAVSPEEVLKEVTVPPEGAVEKVAVPAEELVEEVLLSPEAGEAADTSISGKGEPLSGEGEIIEESGGGAFDAETMEIIEATDEEIAKAHAGSEISEGIDVPSENMTVSPEEVIEEVAVPPAESVLSSEEMVALDEEIVFTDADIGGSDASLAASGSEWSEGAGGGSGESSGSVRVTPAGKDIDGDLREKTDLLSRLAEAAGMLEKLGPDLSGSVYTEEEIREKAQFLSEEFNRYLSVRDKFYNAHILIKGGDYLVGGAHLAKSELAEQIAALPDFYIGKFPVTNALFEIFIEQTGYVTTAEKYGYSIVYYPRMQRSRDPITGVERFSLHSHAYSKKVPGACWHRPLGPDSSLHLKRTHPVVHISLDDARAFASWTGKRLPTEIEWEAAARTARGYLYPWGNEWKEDACNIEKSLHGDTTPVDQYARFANSAGVADLLGNVLEWTSDVIGDREMSDTYIAKGASWIAHSETSLTDRHYIEKNASSNILGFRCVAI